MEDGLRWASAVVAFAVTVVLQTEVALLFVGAGIAGIIYYGSLRRGRRAPSAPILALVPLAAPPPAVAAAAPATLGKLLVFFLKAGSLTFGSGLVIVPFLETGLVHTTGWLDERQFLVAGAVGLLCPGSLPVPPAVVWLPRAGAWGALG